MRKLWIQEINIGAFNGLSYPIDPNFKLLPLPHGGMSMHAMACHMKCDWLATFLANRWRLCRGFFFKVNFT